MRWLTLSLAPRSFRLANGTLMRRLATQAEDAKAPKDAEQKLVGLGVWKVKYELIPLVGFLGLAVVFGVTYTIYALIRKTDIRVLSKKTTDLPPWEEVDPEKRSKLITINQEYKKIPELEKLREEIGKYKH